jgi:hypothetical protein
MPAAVPRECRWLRRAALAIRITVGLLTLACASAAGVVAERTLGSESPWIWTIAFLAGLVGAVVLMGNPKVDRLVQRIEQVAQEHEDRSRTESRTDRGHG